MSLVFRHEERDTQSLQCLQFLHHPPPTPQLDCPAQSQISTLWPNKHAAHPVAPSLTGLASPRVKSQLTSFSKSPNSPAIASGHDLIHTPVRFPLCGFYYDICDCHILCARAWTVLNVCTCTCTNSSKSN